MANDTRGGWWTTAPGLLTAVAALITAGTGLLLALNEVGLLDPTSDETPSQVVAGEPEVDAESSSPAGSGASVAPSASDYDISLPYDEEIRVGDIGYEILGATARPDAEGQLALVLSLRARSYRDYDYNFWDASFRVTAGEDIYPASGGLNDVLPANATQRGELLFVVPDSTRDATLTISFPYDKERSIPIRLRPTSG